MLFLALEKEPKRLPARVNKKQSETGRFTTRSAQTNKTPFPFRTLFINRTEGGQNTAKQIL